jgi:hypothetical protein
LFLFLFLSFFSFLLIRISFFLIRLYQSNGVHRSEEEMWITDEEDEECSVEVNTIFKKINKKLLFIDENFFPG